MKNKNTINNNLIVTLPNGCASNKTVLLSSSPVKKEREKTSQDLSSNISDSQQAGSQTNDEHSLQNSQKKKKRKGSKKKHDGTSNWMNLCKTLSIVPSRKVTVKKRPVEESTESPDPKKMKSDVWFDNVDNILLDTEKTDVDKTTKKDKLDPLVKPDSFKGLTNCVAMDCEMVGVGPSGNESILARVSIVNHFGVCLYDKFVLPREEVTDYRTFVSGVTAENLASGEEFVKVQKEVSDIIHGRILVGHAIHNDLRALFLTHPQRMIRDTSLYKPFRELFSGRLPSLKKLTAKVLGVSVQEGQHSSIQDAQATMRLYTMHRQKWEKEFKQKIRLKKKKRKNKNLK
ncbi:RNA exonuclease 4-like [Biomphalaria glabrata]|uniref:RNA exonuclease 4 n=1 Tax=Biomphalaria glabrata TaxID=6526 RepID=A0A9W3A9V8_BIOGL|nr:RNA exonuclease 4-like [Biomphalaria glabrata]XP_055883947.1 RNA exonuclease 4-like [Biomphalaria glabrata]XP_055883948.1 RNA exonuclease 4-like [Biomphalaria glabrata]XP_055883949.1 RNA exonuclease 4-like [Biomphalaria glabrata]KAI8730948.1 RNA exonuclease 4-like [Biomphalaria glabrata]